MRRIAGQKLVSQKVLTQYQAEQLKSGRTKLSLGPYVITDWLGQGGMGQVFVAMHSIMHREVAIKVLPKSRSTPDAIASFAREIKTQAKLDHRNLVRAMMRATTATSISW
ncbi:MAG: protein kinase [Pirellulaceae bacterium]